MEKSNDRSQYDEESSLIDSRMETFLEELMIEILSRVRILDLPRLSPVCNRWNNILNDPLFRRLHYSHSLSNPTENRVLILQQSSGLYWLDLTHRTSPQEVAINLPCIPPKFWKYEFIGSCNGLMCFGRIKSLGCRILVLNPFTRQSLLFFKELTFYNRTFFAWGFGFDDVTKLFKVILVTSYAVREVTVCDLSSGGATNWRNVAVKAFDMSLRSFRGCFANGRIHWISDNDGLYGIISFDLTDEEFRPIPIPDSLRDSISYGFDLIAFGGCLCIYDSRVLNTPKLQIWVMKKYGIKTSWVKEFYIQPPVPRSLISRLNIDRDIDMKFSDGLGSLKDGELVVLRYGMDTCDAAVLISSKSSCDELYLQLVRPPCVRQVIIHTVSLSWI